ncbi:MAG: Spy/CpxP family protein refolding chaperone [Betaproteobacteria bacterium]|nr:Spy/CpxP family protein refolding chaperone [Betaproteobacteria bacterium]
MKFSKSSVRTSLVALAAAGGLAAWSAPGLAESSSVTGMGPGMMSGAGVRQVVEEQPAGGYGPGYGMGPGMMGGWGGGYGPGMMGGYGMGPGMMGGYGMGPGMMGGYEMGPGMMGGWGGGYGPGMMGGYGMGPGMMGGWGGGYGPGMMGGYGMGPGMMGGYGPLAILDLSDEQAAKIAKIYADARQKQWDLASKTFAAAGKLRELLANEAPDRKAVGSAYKALADLRLQQLEARLDTRAKADAVLTKEQRERLQTWRRGAFAPWH